MAKTSAARVVTTDAEIDAAIIARARRPLRLIETAYYDLIGDKVVVGLSDGIVVSFPRRSLQGLQDATPEQLAAIEFETGPMGLYWPALDVAHDVPGLVAGIFGSHKWLSAEYGRRGGSAKTAVKVTAARINGAKGGRPKGAARTAQPKNEITVDLELDDSFDAMQN